MVGNDLSNLLGWVSIAFWIVVYSPQIIENYRLKSGEGLSIGFVFVWLLGDLCNLAGATLANLLPTVIILAAYYTVCDLILLCQIYFYRWKGTNLITSEIHDEQAPLIERHEGGSSGSATRPIVVIARYLGVTVFVGAVGVMGWALSKWMDKGTTGPQKSKQSTDWTIQIIGWTSASLYLGARVPQIVKNFTSRCEGLSPTLFLFAIFGNSTYALSICVASMEREYLVTNASWLAGSVLTIILDIMVLAQFCYYRWYDQKNLISST